MKHLSSILFLSLLLVTTCFTSCSDDDDKELGSGITGQSWTDGKALQISSENSLNVTFNAKAKWTASSTASWCEVLTKSGDAGESILKLIVSSSTTTARTTTVNIAVSGYAEVSFTVTQNPENVSAGDRDINTQVDEYLSEIYLWNDEYKTLTLDFTKNYEAFFNDALKSMKTNTLDKKYYSANECTLYSYIEKRNPISNTRSTKFVEKELMYSFGLTGMLPLRIQDIGLCYSIQGVYPDSPAAKAGLKRGSIITQINNSAITEHNWQDIYYTLVWPASSQTMILTDMDNNTFTINSQAMYTNPVIKTQVEEINGHKIGYLVYSSFDAAYDDELFNVFKEFKSKGITDLILDLRYNGGGHVISANLIASCVAGASSQGKIFAQYRYNEERMKRDFNNKRPEEKFAYSNYDNLGTSLDAGGLGLSRLYCLVTGNTASASELVINSLRGIDIDVILIGKTTDGKNVGMEYKDLQVNDETYRVVPISFQTYNAKGFSEYSQGFAPDTEINENNPSGEPNVFYNYRDYGTGQEPLYAEALSLITGENKMSGTRSAGNVIKATKYTLPAIAKPGKGGMLKEYTK